jgi:hypothetical protein
MLARVERETLLGVSCRNKFFESVCGGANVTRRAWGISYVLSKSQQLE